MPQSGSSGNDSNNQPGATSAYPNLRNNALAKIVGVFFAIMLLKNVIFNDYKKEEIEILRALGKTEEEISMYVDPSNLTPSKKQSDTMKTLVSDMENLKEDVKRLKKEVFDKGTGLRKITK